MTLRRWIVVSAAAVALAAGAIGWLVGRAPKHPARTPTRTRPDNRSAVPPARPGSPNIVFVLTDDLSLNLLRFMPHVRAMERAGMSFSNYFVTDSLCCPSRSSIFTGEYPHDTGVYGNFGRDGGFQTFYERGEESHTFAVTLERAGYWTAMMGKYLNGYLDDRAEPAGYVGPRPSAKYVPPGWVEWDVAGFGYPEFDYRLNENGVITDHGHRPRDYLTDVLAGKGTGFIGAAAAAHRPFFLELATFAPHGPYVPAPRNRRDFPGLRVPRPPNFDVMPTHAPRWLAHVPRLTRRDIGSIDRVFRLRAQSVEAVDRLIANVERTLRRLGLSRNTYLVFSSDNGFHTGEYRLEPGKLTAFDTDIRVPLVVVGPHVARGRTAPQFAENIDLAETFAAIAGAALSADGRSLLPILDGRRTPGWRTTALVEHHGPTPSPLDPDRQVYVSGTPTTYEAMRIPGFLYVEYSDGEREFYDLRRDPFELDNVFASLRARRRRRLHAELAALTHCRGASACWRAGHVTR